MAPVARELDSVTAHRPWALCPAGAAVIAAWPPARSSAAICTQAQQAQERTSLVCQILQLPPPPCSIAPNGTLHTGLLAV